MLHLFWTIKYFCRFNFRPNICDPTLELLKLWGISAGSCQEICSVFLSFFIELIFSSRAAAFIEFQDLIKGVTDACDLNVLSIAFKVILGSHFRVVETVKNGHKIVNIVFVTLKISAH